MGALFYKMSTQIKSTVQDILQIVADVRGETTVDVSAKRIRAVARGDSDFANRKFWHFYRLPDQTMSGTGSNDLTIGSSTRPCRVKGLMELFVGSTIEGNRYNIVSYETFKSRFNQNNSEKNCYIWYDAANDLWKIHFSVIPTASETVTYTYFWEPATQTLTTDSVITPNPDIQARLANAYLFEGDDEEKYQDQLAIAESLIGEEEGKEEQPSVNEVITFGMPSQTKGLGTY